MVRLSDRASAKRSALRDATTAPAVRWVDRLLDDAAAARASDLHLQPGEGQLDVRARIDGALVAQPPPPSALVRGVFVRLRLLAGVDLAEQRRPQDGRFSLAASGGDIDVRAAFLPVSGGERIALRLLRRDDGARPLAELDFDAPSLAAYRKALSRNAGLVVVAGPTGSGKTTTLYAGLRELSTPERSVATVEDPVEIRVPGVAQVPIDEGAARTFATVLRALLRQDPDVLMVGEIRDTDSARIACRAALTGHLVLTTVHAATAAEARLRLCDIGVAEHLVDATVSLVLAQRLLRRPCAACVRLCPTEKALRRLFDRARLTAPSRIATVVGCEACRGTGYRGRVPVVEALSPGHRAPDAAPSDAAPSAAGLLHAGLFQAGLRRVADAETTLEEVLARCPEPDTGARGAPS